MRCGHCKSEHETVLEVRRCAGVVEPISRPAMPAARKLTPVQEIREIAKTLPQIENARYMVGDAIYFVDMPQHGKWKGYIFVKDEHKSSMTFFKQIQVLRLIAENPDKAFRAYGIKTGKCGICGRKLTDPVSVRDGIGPICASRLAA